MLATKDLVRAAERLHAAITARPRHLHSSEREAFLRWKNSEHGLRIARSRLRKARRHGLGLILPQLTADVRSRLEAVRGPLDDLLDRLAPEPCETPSLSSLVAELRQLEEEFGSLQVNWCEKWLGVSTE